MVVGIARQIYDRFLAASVGWDVIHWLATGVMLWWGVVLFLPGNTMSVSPSYDIFLSLANEQVWGVFFISSGAFGLWAVFSKTTEVRIVAAMLLSVMHGMVAMLLVLGNPFNTGTGTYAIIAVAVSLRLWRLVRVAAL